MPWLCGGGSKGAVLAKSPTAVTTPEERLSSSNTQPFNSTLTPPQHERRQLEQKSSPIQSLKSKRSSLASIDYSPPGSPSELRQTWMNLVTEAQEREESQHRPPEKPKVASLIARFEKK